MSETTLHAALAALYDLAPKCDVCEEHARTRRGEDVNTGGHEVCDREDCGDWIRCERCGETDDVGAAEGSPCAWCGRTNMIREPRSTVWRDLPHAEALRAANATHEARR